MNLLSNQPRSPEAKAIRDRIFKVLPAASYQMERLFGLLDIDFSQDTQTACVECSPTPRLLLNREFVESYCSSDEDLFLLILHELHHVILGHTRLFPRGNRIDNIVFDAVINSMLARSVGSSAGVNLFVATNSFDSFPGRLLRPPPGWPGSFEDAIEPLPPLEKRAIQLLYGPDDGTVTYFDIYETLRKSLPSSGHQPNAPLPADAATGSEAPAQAGSIHSPDSREGTEIQNPAPGRSPLPDADPSDCLLLGNHAAEAPKNTLLDSVIRNLVEGWPQPPFRIGGRDNGRTAGAYFLENVKPPGADFRSAFKQALRKCGVHPGRGRQHHEFKPSVCERMTETVVPNPRDRRLATLRLLTGVTPIVQRAPVREPRRRLERVPVVHLYLDVSGSMSQYLPFITAACVEPFRRREIKLYAFSTIVSEAKGADLTRVPLDSTGGTDIRCVLRHVLGLPGRKRPKTILVVTDGWVGQPPEDLMRELGKIRTVAALTAPHYPADLEGKFTQIIRLPKI